MHVRITPSLFRAVVASLAFFGGLHAGVPAVSSPAAPTHDVVAPGAASCAEDCNRKASDCLDGCEERFKSDDRARVTCKFECANHRQQCEKDCS
jgi:hypothetical protein